MESHWLGCRIGKHEFCFEMGEVRSIEGHDSVRAGMLRIAGVQVPVHSLAQLLGLESHSKGPILVLSDGVASFCVQVDSVFRGEGQESLEVFALPSVSGGQSGICYGVTRMNGRLVPCLDSGRLHPDASCRWYTSRTVTPNALPHFDQVTQPDSKRMLCFGTARNDAAVKTVCGISYSQLLEVAQDLHVVKVPGLDENSCLLGVADWRGAIVPVLDVRQYLDLRHASAGEEGLFAILRGIRKAEVFVVPMREVRTVTLPLSNATLRESAADPAMPLRGAFVYQGGKLLVPDFDGFLTKRM